MLPIRVDRNDPVQLLRVPFNDDDIPVLDESKLEVFVLSRLDVMGTEGDVYV